MYNQKGKDSRMKNSFLKTKVALVSLVLLTGAAVNASAYDKILDELVRGKSKASNSSISGNLSVAGTSSLTGAVTAAGAATVSGDLTLGNQRIVGQFNNFNPARDQVMLSFTSEGLQAKPAMINWTFVTTTTWVGTTGRRNEPVVVVATNAGLPDIISPATPGRSFVSSDMLYTNTVYMWTSRQNTGIDFKDKTWANHNRPRSSAYYSAVNQDLTITSSARSTNQSKVFGWGLTASNLSNFHVGVHASNALTTNTNSPFSAGTLYYEIVGDNVADVTLGKTWDAPLTVGGVLSQFTQAQLTELLDDLLALLGSVSLRGKNKKMSKAQLIAKILQHKELLSKVAGIGR